MNVEPLNPGRIKSNGPYFQLKQIQTIIASIQQLITPPETKNTKIGIEVPVFVVQNAKKTLEHAGHTDFAHIRITDLGCVKGKSSADNDTVLRITGEIGTMLL